MLRDILEYREAFSGDSQYHMKRSLSVNVTWSNVIKLIELKGTCSFVNAWQNYSHIPSHELTAVTERGWTKNGQNCLAKLSDNPSAPSLYFSCNFANIFKNDFC